MSDFMIEPQLLVSLREGSVLAVVPLASRFSLFEGEGKT